MEAERQPLTAEQLEMANAVREACRQGSRSYVTPGGLEYWPAQDRFNALIAALLARAEAAEAALRDAAHELRKINEPRGLADEPASFHARRALSIIDAALVGSSPAAETSEPGLVCSVCGWLYGHTPNVPNHYPFTDGEQALCAGSGKPGITQREHVTQHVPSSPAAEVEPWDCGCPFNGPHNENCALAASGVSDTRDDGRRITSPFDVPAARALIVRLCELQREVADVVDANSDYPYDCFCGESGFWPLGKVASFKNTGTCVDFIVEATRAALESYAASPVPAVADDPELEETP